MKNEGYEIIPSKVYAWVGGLPRKSICHYQPSGLSGSLLGFKYEMGEFRFNGYRGALSELAKKTCNKRLG